MTQGEMTILKIYIFILFTSSYNVSTNFVCNPGEYTGKTGCFQLLAENRNITEAKNYCSSRNMTLAPFLKHKDSGTMKDWIHYLFHLYPR